jgi:two-component system, sensor histidine kinase
MAEISSLAQRLLQVSPDALLVIDEHGVIQFSNETSGSLFGYSPEHLIGQPIHLLIPERFHARHGSHLASYLADPTNREMGARITDLYARRADGTEFPAGIRLSPFRDGDQGFVAAAVRDMTERRMISDALVAAREEADRANRAKSRFLATASHDLRQPLQAIRLINASMHTLTRGNAGLSDLVAQQENAIDSATRLLNALLDISRLESGAIDPQLAPFGLAAALSEIAGEFAPAAAAKHLDLEIVDTDIVLVTDRVLFTQLLQNVVGNSIKYTERGHVRISQSLDEDALLLKIEDTGVGISEDKLDRVFDEYYQIGPQGTHRAGVGLGLAIVREVARLLGYSVTVASRLGEGTCVSVRIPAHRLLALRDGGGGEEPAQVRSAPTETRRLVLLEDNDSVRKATELFLSLEGFVVRSAANVAQAAVLLEDFAPGDVLITDYHLDGKVTGLDVLLELRRNKCRDVPAIVMSGDLQSMMRVVRTTLPRCRFLSKPVDTRALLSAIAEVCGDL